MSASGFGVLSVVGFNEKEKRNWHTKVRRVSFSLLVLLLADTSLVDFADDWTHLAALDIHMLS